MKPDTNVVYPDDMIRYIDVFRRQFLDYSEVRTRLHDFLQTRPHKTETFCEFGSGTGTNLFGLEELGYKAIGVDSNSESVELAKQRAKERGSKVEFSHVNFHYQVPDIEVDCAIVFFVPLTLRDMSALAMRASKIVKKGGHFACMMLMPEPTNKLGDHFQNMEFGTLGDETVVRLNFYNKTGTNIVWDTVYLVATDGRCRMVRDQDTMRLVEEQSRLIVPADMYKHVHRLDLSGCKALQTPPMTVELCDVYERL